MGEEVGINLFIEQLSVSSESEDSVSSKSKDPWVPNSKNYICRQLSRETLICVQGNMARIFCAEMFIVVNYRNSSAQKQVTINKSMMGYFTCSISFLQKETTSDDYGRNASNNQDDGYSNFSFSFFSVFWKYF